MLTQRIQAVQSSPTLRITALVKKLIAEGKSVINLAGGEPDFDTPERIKKAAIQAIQEGFTKYTPTTGIPELKEAIATLLKRQHGLTYSPSQIAVTCGAKQAVFNTLQVLAQSGDEVLIPSPYWVSYPDMVRLAGAAPVHVRTESSHGFRLSAKLIERACTARTRVLILNSPANPTGAVLDRGSLKEIAQVAASRGLWVVSDEIYSRLSYDGPAPSIAELSPETLKWTVVIDGVSKAYAMTGWRIGYLAGPIEVVEATARLQDHSTSNPASISQKAALAALTGGEEELDRMVQEFKKRRDILVERIQEIPRLSLTKPQGAFYGFIDISELRLDSARFCERALQEAGLALIPGAGFGWDSHVRLSFCLKTELLIEGLDRLQKFVGGL